MNTENMILVFGSNLSGIHGAGAARYAFESKGAVWGKATGFQGQSYAIPTKDKQIHHTLPLDTIDAYVRDFLYHVRANPNLDFQVTCIGCGLAGLKHSDVAPLFRYQRMDTLPNIYFDELWKPYLCSNAKFWGTF